MPHLQNYPHVWRRQRNVFPRALLCQGEQVRAYAPPAKVGMNTHISPHEHIRTLAYRRVSGDASIATHGKPGVCLGMKILVPPIAEQLVQWTVGHTTVRHVAGVEHFADDLQFLFARRVDAKIGRQSSLSHHVCPLYIRFVTPTPARAPTACPSWIWCETCASHHIQDGHATST